MFASAPSTRAGFVTFPSTAPNWACTAGFDRAAVNLFPASEMDSTSDVWVGVVVAMVWKVFAKVCCQTVSGLSNADRFTASIEDGDATCTSGSVGVTRAGVTATAAAVVMATPAARNFPR